MLTPERRRRAEQAAQILQSEVFNDALASIEDDLCAQWRGCGDMQERETLWQALQASRRLRAAILRELEDAAFDDEQDGVFRRLLRMINGGK